FVEVGSSGRRWRRAELIEAMVGDPEPDDAEVRDLAARAIDGDTALVTYISVRGGRATPPPSTWGRGDARGRRRHPQGPAAAGGGGGAEVAGGCWSAWECRWRSSRRVAGGR